MLRRKEKQDVSDQLQSLSLKPKLETIIIAVGGASTAPVEHWTDQTGQEWLHSLPAPEPGLYGYTPSPYEASDLSWSSLLHSGKRLWSSLHTLVEQQKLDHCPVVLLGHGTGGLIIKEALRLAHERNEKRYRRVRRALAAAILLGTPHMISESDERWNIVAPLLLPSKRITKKLRIAPDDMQRLANSCLYFERTASEVPILSIFEQQKSKPRSLSLSGTKSVAIDEKCVRIGTTNETLLGIDADHKALCHMQTDSSGFGRLSDFVSKALEDTRLRVMEVSPLFPEQSISDDWTDAGEQRSGGLIAGSSTDPTLSSEQPTNRPTAGSTEPDFEIVPLAGPVISELKGPSLPCFIMPIANNQKDFFGRQTALNSIREAFKSGHSPLDGKKEAKTFALCGPGGVGKTEIAKRFAYEGRDSSEFDAIFWVHAETAKKVDDAFASIAIRLQLLDADSSDIHDPVVARELVKGWLSNPSEREDPLVPGGKVHASWLLVFDNVDNISVLEDLWPLDGPGCVLITSRDPLAMHHSILAAGGLDLDPFRVDEGAAYLEKLTRKSGQSREVCKRLGGFPLAISQMASIIIRRHLSFSDFIENWDSKEAHRDLFRGDERRNHPNQDTKTLATVWALESLNHGRSLIDVLAFMDADGIQQELLTPKSPPADILMDYPHASYAYQQARRELQQSSLVQRDEATGKLTIHRIIQDAARFSLHEDRWAQAFGTALSLVVLPWPFIEFGWRHGTKRWKACEALFPHVERLRSHGREFEITERRADLGLSFAKLLNDAGWYHHETGHSEEATPYFQDAQSIASRVKSFRQPLDLTDRSLKDFQHRADAILAEAHHNLGCIGTETNEPELTLHHFKAYNAIMRQEIDLQMERSDSRLAISWNELGNAYMMNEDWIEGESCFEKCISITQRHQAFKPEDLSFPLVNLGLAYWFMDRHDEALETLLKGLKHREDAFGPDDTESFKTGRFLHALGNVTASLGDPAGSFKYHKRALSQYEKTIGKSHHRTGDVHVKVAEHHIRLRRFDEALTHLDEALQIFGERKVYRPERCRALFKKSLVLPQLQSQGEAANAYEESIAIYRGLTHKRKVPDAKEPGERDFDSIVAFWSR